ncbi:MAG: hypothetical protein IKE43_11270 [Coriobacteriales bacterium]|nr:hypothetical protein [Coriobacteriales bacterium]
MLTAANRFDAEQTNFSPDKHTCHKLSYMFAAFICVIALFFLALQPVFASETSPVSGDSTVEDAVVQKRIQSCGLEFAVPQTANVVALAYDYAVWRISYDDENMLQIGSFVYESGTEDEDVKDFTLSMLDLLASTAEKPRIDRGDWMEYGDVMAYACGYTTKYKMTMLVVVPVDDNHVSVLLFSFGGTQSSLAVQDIAGMLNSLALAPDGVPTRELRGPLAYYHILDLMALTSAQIVDVLEEGASTIEPLKYVESDEFCGWVGEDGGPLGAKGGCTVVLYTRGNAKVQISDAGTPVALTPETASTIDPIASREDALAGTELSGIEITWYAVPAVEWDEAPDLVAAVTRASRLT